MMRVLNKLRPGLPGTTRNTNTNKVQRTNGFMQRPKTRPEMKLFFVVSNVALELSAG